MRLTRCWSCRLRNTFVKEQPILSTSVTGTKQRFSHCKPGFIVEPTLSSLVALGAVFKPNSVPPVMIKLTLWQLYCFSEQQPTRFQHIREAPVEEGYTMTSSYRPHHHIFRVTGPFVGGIHRWIPLTKASDAELWCFLWSASEQTVEKQSVIWYVITPIITSL